MKNFYVTTSIPYVNGEPHIGFAMELIQADVLARFARSEKRPTIFATGTDEHGQKVAEKAAELKLETNDYADKVSQKFRDLDKLLNISPDLFIRTTDSDHEHRAQLIWKALEKYIYKGKYSGWYDVRQEEFVSESQADPERMKPDHPQAYKKLEEENYFFKLSGFTQKVKQAIESGSFEVLPATRRNEVLALLEDGLEDISISRPKDKLAWGISVPGDDSQVMYVWFEAVMYYLTGLGYPDGENFKNFWPPNVQVIGKDIVRFHAAILPAMLLGLNLPLTQTLYVHGFINVAGEKMSKSIGNVISPADIVNKYGVDALRYYFLRHIPSYDDGDFSWEKINDAYNNELGNDLGNALQRSLTMINSYLDGKIPEPKTIKVDEYLAKELLKCRFDKSLELIWVQVRNLNQYIEDNKPWVLNKEGKKDELEKVLNSLVDQLRNIAYMLQAFLPETSGKINEALSGTKLKMPETSLFPKIDG